MKLDKYLAHPAVKASRTAAGELGVGLASAWLVLSLVELMRRGAVSLHLDLNLLLAAALAAWLAGERPPAAKPWQKYVSTAIFAILIAVLAWRLSEGQSWHMYAPLVGLAAFLSLVP